MLGALALVLGIGLWLAGRLLRPIAAITATAQQISDRNDLSRRIGITSTPSDEVGRLAETFNGMLARLEAVFATQRQFVADASHELKTPLTAILGHANLVRRHGAADPYVVGEATTAILEEGERMRRLVQSLLHLAQTDSAPVRRSECVNVSLIAREVVREMMPLAQERGLHLQLHEANEREPLIYGSSDELRQVVLNLVDNAFNATATGGSVRLAVTTLIVDGQECIALEVADTGDGIAPDDLVRIFERFYRVDAARARGAGGSGLGLAIGRALVHQHGGSLSAESQLGVGSTFRVLLPRCIGYLDC